MTGGCHFSNLRHVCGDSFHALQCPGVFGWKWEFMGNHCKLQPRSQGSGSWKGGSFLGSRPTGSVGRVGENSGNEVVQALLPPPRFHVSSRVPLTRLLLTISPNRELARRPRLRLWHGPIARFSARRASVWSKNKVMGGATLDPPLGLWAVS